jgi:hypothetical protein
VTSAAARLLTIYFTNWECNESCTSTQPAHILQLLLSHTRAKHPQHLVIIEPFGPLKEISRRGATMDLHQLIDYARGEIAKATAKPAPATAKE